MTYTEYQAQATALANSMATMLCFDDIVATQQQLMNLQVALFDYLSTAGDQNAEVVAARETYSTLDARLDYMEDDLVYCLTAAATAGKTATKTGFVLKTGKIIAVRFTYANTVANPTLNVNSTGAKNIYRKGAVLDAGAYWSAGDVVEFIYDGTNWAMLDNGALDKLIVRVPVGSMVQQRVATFLKLASNQSLTNGVNAKIALVKQVGDLAVASNEITLPAGFYYEISYGVGNTTSDSTGAVVVAKVVKSDGTGVGDGSTVTARGVTLNWGAAENQVGCHFIDLTSGAPQTVIKLNTTAVEGNQSLIADNTWMVIKQMKKAV